MFKISLMDHLDLEDAYKIELETNPSPWSKDNFFSSFEVGHKSLVCKYNDDVIGFLIYSLIKMESHLLNIAVLRKWQKKGAGTTLMSVYIKQSKTLEMRWSQPLVSLNITQVRWTNFLDRLSLLERNL